MEEQAQYPHNGILRLYNQFPGMYANLAEMTTDIPRIAAMGFNAVWVNPLHPTCAVPVERRTKERVIHLAGSLYAISNFREISPHIGSEQSLCEYSAQLRQQGLIPVFDLVLRHVARDIDFATQGLSKQWFKPFNPEKEMNDTLDFVYAKPVGKTRKLDQKFFDSADKTWPEIFENFWIPYIDRFMRGYGFRGVRIDAVKHLPTYVLKDVCNYIHRRYPGAVIFAELLFLGANPKAQIEEYLNLGFTHITNSLYSQPFDFESRKHGRWKSGQKIGEGDLVRNMLG